MHHLPFEGSMSSVRSSRQVVRGRVVPRITALGNWHWVKNGLQNMLSFSSCRPPKTWEQQISLTLACSHTVRNEHFGGALRKMLTTAGQIICVPLFLSLSLSLSLSLAHTHARTHACAHKGAHTHAHVAHMRAHSHTSAHTHTQPQ